MNNGSASGLSVLAGSIATDSASVRPPGFERSSGTSTVAHCAACASLAKRHSCNATWRVTALSPQPPRSRTISETAQARRSIAHGLQAAHFTMRGMVAEEGRAPAGSQRTRGVVQLRGGHAATPFLYSAIEVYLPAMSKHPLE